MYVPRAMYSFRMSFWIVPRSLSRGHALLLGDRDVEQQQDRRGRVDRHRRRDLVERQPVEQQRACRRASRSRRRRGRPRPRRAGGRSRGPSASADRTRTTEPGLALRRAGSGSARSTRSAVPKPAYWRIVQSRPRYMRRVDAARVGGLPGRAELRRGVPTRRGRRPCTRLDLDARVGRGVFVRQCRQVTDSGGQRGPGPGAGSDARCGMQRSSYSAMTMGAASRRTPGTRVTAHLVLAERLLEAVVGEQPPDERVAEAEQQLDGLDGLDRPDDAGQHAEHAGLGARRRQLGGRRLGDHVAVGRTVLRVEDGDHALEAEDRAVDDGDAELHATRR